MFPVLILVWTAQVVWFLVTFPVRARRTRAHWTDWAMWVVCAALVALIVFTA